MDHPKLDRLIAHVNPAHATGLLKILEANQALFQTKTPMDFYLASRRLLIESGCIKLEEVGSSTLHPDFLTAMNGEALIVLYSLWSGKVLVYNSGNMVECDESKVQEEYTRQALRELMPLGPSGFKVPTHSGYICSIRDFDRRRGIIDMNILPLTYSQAVEIFLDEEVKRAIEYCTDADRLGFIRELEV